MSPIHFKSLLSTATAQKGSHSLRLAAGQVVKGQVLKLFPNHLAALRIGHTTVTAKLEASLAAGESYFFKVVPSEGIPRLRLLHPSIDYSHSEQRSKLLIELGMRQTRGNQWLLNYFLKNNLPFQEEQLAKGGDLLQRSGAFHEKGGEIVREMMERRLPFTQEVFSAISALKEGSSVSSQIQELIRTGEAFREKGNLTKSAADFLAHLQRLQASMQVSETAYKEKEPLLSLLTLAVKEGSKEKAGALQLLERLNLVPQGAHKNLQYFYEAQAQFFKRLSRQPVQEMARKITTLPLPVLEKMQPQQLFPLLMESALLQEKGVHSKGMKALLQLFHSFANNQPEARPFYTLVTLYEQGELTKDEREALLSLISSNTASPLLPNHVKSLLYSLGMQHENMLQSSFITGSKRNENIKALLLHYSPLLASPLKERAELLLQRITGQQLLALESQHPFLNGAIQLPLFIDKHNSDITIQWEGQRRADGSLNEDHCRLLIFLELEMLKETLADVQIQNRVISITLYSENRPPAAVLKGLQPYLKQKLEENDYILSSLQWKDGHSLLHTVSSYTQENNPVHIGRMDIRI
ncbi:hypothetical protein ACFPU1_05185 [Thalassorhabdus alkalitolerans]|uniref:Flagellar hook-length control protein FliK n=1 Tax=Thalassorhabdus alkalitolerans TaxID=2282697 RepID=A0ABW0YIJ0_9BACI